VVDAHLRDAPAHGLAVAEVAGFRTIDARLDSCSRRSVPEALEPPVEDRGRVDHRHWAMLGAAWSRVNHGSQRFHPTLPRFCARPADEWVPVPFLLRFHDRLCLAAIRFLLRLALAGGQYK